ncbi:MAG: 2,3,4,5-tetrahydropyridine-2,6-dicarboxylate N-succinyltransferase, partial [Alphaproteobacteria bacterium]
MNTDHLQSLIEATWDDRDRIGPDAADDVRDAVEAALDGLDGGRYRVAEPRDGGWHVNQWLKKAVLLSFRLKDMTPISGGPG